ncbi:unnamed protein product, partial [Meganyctiphanes norvegica]
EVRGLLLGYMVHSVQLQASNGSARVLLAEPEVLETFSKTSHHTLRGQKVTISPSNTEGLLCVAHLPCEFTDDDLSALVAALGEVSHCFLMLSETTGEGKGYGFVEYVTKEVALQAKACLDGRELRDTTLVCDWLDPSHVTFSSLNSTCLYVDQLPKDYRDMGEFRRIFSKIANPPYCQIAMKAGALQDWGLVEFNNPQEAEETQAALNKYKIKGQGIRVQYCIPGVRAINIYMKILNEQPNKKKTALLPEPPANKVFTQLQNLTKHNPAFATSLQNIILTQIQNLQSGGGARGAEPGRGPSVPVGPRSDGPQQPPPRPPMHRPPPPGPPPPPTHTPPPSLNTNAQAALVILLAAQMQMQQQQQQQQSTNLLGNPQVMNLLQTLVQQGDPRSPQQKQQQQSQQHPPLDHRNGYPPSNNNNANINKSNFRNNFYKNGTNKPVKTPLLPTPVSTGYGSGLPPPTHQPPQPPLGPSQNGYEDPTSSGSNTAPGSRGESPVQDPLTPLLSGLLGNLPGLLPQKTGKEELHSTISTLLTNAHSLQQLLGTLQPSDNNGFATVPPPPILAHPPPPIVSSNGLIPTHQPPPNMLYATNPLMSMLMNYTTANSTPKPALLGDGPPRHELQHPPPPPPPSGYPPIPSMDNPPPVPVSSAPTFMFASPVSSRVSTPSYTPPPTMHPHMPPPAMQMPPIFQPHPHLPQPRLMAPLLYRMGPPAHLHGAIGNGYSTPPGQKRKLSHILPSPEPSPPNGYVGQHSQGIGGHYQDSYLINKKFKKH